MIEWSLKSFEQLSLQELYAIGQLRQAVFVVEQDCPYLDFDGLDDRCQHLMACQAGDLLAYARIVPQGLAYANDIAIGRVITAQQVRGQGLGKTLMQKAVAHCQFMFPKRGIRLSAQTHLLKFYQDLGFASTGKEYLEDGIPHTEMLLN